MSIPNKAYPARLSKTLALGLLGAFAWWPLNAAVEVQPFDTFGALVHLALLGLAPIPAVAAATLLVRDFGWRRGLVGAPAALLALVLPGAWHLVAFTLAETGAT